MKTISSPFISAILAIVLLLPPCAGMAQDHWTQEESGTNQYLLSIDDTEGLLRTCGGAGVLLQSTGEGSWQDGSLETMEFLVSIDFSDAQHGTAAGTGGFLATTSDGGLSWTTILEGWMITHSKVLAFDELTVLTLGKATINNGQWHKTTNGWEEYITDNYFPVWEEVGFESEFIDAQLVGDTLFGLMWLHTFGPEFGALVTSVDLGENWETRMILDFHPYALNWIGDEICYIVGEYGNMLRSWDGGASWTHLNCGTNMDLLSVEFTDAFTGYAAGFWGTLMKTLDGGATWAQLASPSLETLSAIHFRDEEEGWIVGEKGTILHTTDAGGYGFDVNLPPTGFSVLSPEPMAAVGPGAVQFSWTPSTDPEGEDILYRFRLMSMHWDTTFTTSETACSIDLSARIITDVPMEVYYLVVAEDGVLRTEGSAGIRNLWYDPALTAVEEHHSLPRTTALHDAYPNPFNPVTEICFELSSSEWVRLAVYDLLGREVASLVNQPLAAGGHKVVFEGAGLTTGVYFYRLEAGDFCQTKKMLLVK